uniref:Bet v I/Major latex protein domain-containing protein n=1 Tax=Salix viminalis TaxID=40686 RepID=A0A6N2N8V8_SALVM
MIKEVKTQANIRVGVDVLWKALAKDLKDILPKMMQIFVKDAHINKMRSSRSWISHHKATFQLTSTGEQNTLIDVMISYESETKEECHQIHHHQHYFIKNMENYLMLDGT